MKTVVYFFTRRWPQMPALLILLAIALAGAIPENVTAQTSFTEIDIRTVGTNPFVINPGDGNFVIKGGGVQTANRIRVMNGYNDTIMLDNVNIVCPIDWAPMRIFGTFNGSNNTPTTKVTLILKGNNYLNSGNGANSVAAGLQVDQGAQVNISAIDPDDNSSGYLKADTRNTDMSIAGAAGIGGSCVQNTNGDAGSTGTYIGSCPENGGNYMYAGSSSSYGGSRRTTGGNIVITSGTIVAQGGNCGAGIGGGGWTGLYTGNIMITGGDVTAIGGVHSPGIGGGCDSGSGNIGSYAPGTSVIAVPPAKITATTPNAGKGLSGAEIIVYIGDPQSPPFTVYTEDYRNTTMYLDLSGDPKVRAKLNQFAPTRDPQRMYLGEAKVYPADGLSLWNAEFAGKNIVQNYGTFTGDITFFTDAKNDKGFEYVPETRTMTPNIKVKLNAPIYDPIMTMTKYEPVIGAVAPMDTSDLLLGYLDAEATAKAVTLTFKNNGNTNLHNPTIEIVAPYHTAHDGSSLNDAIQVALAAALAPDATKGPYLAPGDEFQVKARLNTGLGVGTYTGAVRFDADNVPPAMIKPIPFSVNVVRIMLPAPELATDPAGLSETNAPVEVEATFIRPVTGMTDADIQCTGGTVSGMTPVGASPAEKWRFTVTPQVGLESGQFIQLYAKQNIAYDSHGIRTDERSNALGMKYNTDRPYATFYFPYDITADSVFVTAQNRFTFTIEANGGSGTDADSLWEDTGVSFMDMSFVTPSVTMEKDGAPFSSFSVAAYEWDEATGAHTVTVTGAFDEGAYKVILAANRFRNNVGNLMEETVSGFNVRIPVILPGGSYPGPDIGYGIEPDPVTLPYPGGSVLLTVTGKNLQYARAMGILHIQMPPSLGSVLVEPNATAGGDTATFRVTLPGNSTVTTAAHPFTLLLNGSMPDPDAIGYTRVAPAPTIAIDPLPDKWFGMCEYLLTATIPDNGAAREVTITYLGLAKDYLAMPPVNARPPVRVTLESGETQLPPIPLRTLRVPDGQEAGTGAIVISSPGLPNDTSVWFQFYNTPNVDNMVYYAPTTMYPGLLELNIRGGSPSLERSFNGVTWENAWLPVTPLQISNLESGVIYFREPDGCEDEMHLHLRGFQGGEGIAPPQITREIQLTQQANILTDPAAGMHWVNSGRDFAFTVTLTGPSSGMWPEVTTSRQLMSDEEGVTVVPLGNDVFSVTVHHILEHFTIHIRAVENLSQDTEQVNGPRVWTTEGTVHIYATHPGEAYVYTLAGVPVKHFRLEGGRTNSTPLNAGFYVVVTLRDGQRYKIVIP